MIRSLASFFFYGNKMYFLQVIIGLGFKKTLTKLVRDSAPQKASQYSSYPPSDTTSNKIGKEPCWKAQQHVLLSTSKPNFICKTDHHKWKSRKRWLLEILCWNDLPSGHSFWVTPNYRHLKSLILTTTAGQSTTLHPAQTTAGQSTTAGQQLLARIFCRLLHDSVIQV